MIPLGPVVARSRTKASRASVWAHVTDPVLRSQWWPSLELEPGIGGAVRSVDGADGVASPAGQARELVGAIDVWVNGHALGFTWSVPGEERGSAVLITLRSQGHHTGVTVTETGFDALPGGAVRADAAGRDWNRFVEALAEASLDESAVGAAGAGAGAGAAAVSAGVVGAAAGAGGAGAGAGASAGAEEKGAPASADLEHSPLPIEGELASEDEAAPIEVDAEPGLGDHLELVTGPIALTQADASGTVETGGTVEANGAVETDDTADDAGAAGDANQNDTNRNDPNQNDTDAALFHAARRQEVMDRDLMDREFEETDEARRNPNIVPLVLPGPPISTTGENAPAAAEQSPSVTEGTQDRDAAQDRDTDQDRDAAQAQDHHDDPEEPDFDSLLRGLL